MLFVRNSETLWKKVEGVCYLMAERGFVYELNEVAGYLWELLKSPLSVEQLTGKVCHKYKVNKTEAEEDIQEFIKTYIKLGYVKQVA